MRFWLFFLFLLACSVNAVPVSPTGISADFIEGGTRISWQHVGGQDVSFKVYRGETIESVNVIKNVSENFFVDKNALVGKEYVYLVTAVDSDGESTAKGYVSVKLLAPEEKSFTIRLVEPVEKTIDLGTIKQLNFLVAIDSNNFALLKDLNAVLINNDLETIESFSFDPQKHLFSISAKLPEKEPLQVMQTTYTVLVTATVNGEPVSESIDAIFTFVPSSKPPDVFALAKNFFSLIWPIVLVLFVAGTIAGVWWRWSLAWKQKRDEFKRELLKIHAERKSIRFQAYKLRISEEQYRREDLELEARQHVLQKQFNILKEGIDPFSDFSPEQLKEFTESIDTIKRPDKGVSKEAFVSNLLQAGKSEKVAKKLAELFYEK